VPKILVCLSQTFSVNATIVKLTVAPPSNCIVTTYKDNDKHYMTTKYLPNSVLQRHTTNM